MTQTLRVYCKDCTDGTAADGFGCTVCTAQGHLDVDAHDVEREGFRLWVDRKLPETPVNPWVASNPRCVP